MVKVTYDFKIVSLNVRGINNRVKRLGIFDWAKKKNFDIVMLQECYSREDNTSQWEDEWGRKCIFSLGTKYSKGTMLMFKNGLDLELVNQWVDSDGRYIIVKTVIQGEPFTLINIYAPNTMTEKQIFFNKVKRLLETLDINNNNIIVGGDWNTIQDGSLDKKGGRLLNCQTVTKSYQELLDQLNLIDIWRIRNPTVSKYTCRQKTPLIQSRIDYFMISNNLQDYIVSTDIIPSIWSDHSAVVIDIKHLPECERGSGYWKYNSSLNTDIIYTNTLCHKIVQWNSNYETLVDKRTVWELMKYEIRKFTMSYCAQKKLSKKRLNTQMLQELQTLENEISIDHDENKMTRLCQVKAELLEQEREKIEGLILRSKVKWVEEGEKSTKYFFGLEKNNFTKKHIRKLKLTDDSIITDEKNINLEIKTFYQSLYQSQSQEEVKDNVFFMSNNIPKLSKNDQEVCDTPLTKQECFKTLKTFKKGKSPGNDGLTLEFYEKFWCLISNKLFASYEESFIAGELSSSQKQAIITLIEKGKDRLQLKNWRPISLINFDCKILSKALSLRIQKFLPDLINSNQSGFVQGRYIGDSIRNIQDIMQYTKQRQLEGILLFVDFEKAFDSIEWKYLWKVLEKFNFGEGFIRWIKILYTNISSSIMNNGTTSGYFDLGRGVRQGDPLSPYLFILAIELLAIKIRENKDVKGFTIKHTEYKLTMFADDMTIFVESLKSAKKAFHIFKEFAKISGLRMNLEKTEGMWLGSQRGCQNKPLGIAWPSKPIKSLGIFHSYNELDCENVNFSNKIAQLKRQLHWWKARNLTIEGKILIIKALGISKFSLVSSLLHVPEYIIKEVNTMIYNFIWNGVDKVKRKILTQTFEKGGLKMIDFGNYVKATKCKFIQKYLNNQGDSWKEAFEYFLCKQNLGLFLRSNFSLNEIPKYIPRYYLDSLEAWNELRINISSLIDVKEDFLWYNKNLAINGKTVYNERLFMAGLWSISDLFDRNDICIPFGVWVGRGAHLTDFMLWRGIVNMVKQKQMPHIKLDLNKGIVVINGKEKEIDILSQKELLKVYNDNDYKKLKQGDFKAKSKFNNAYGPLSETDWKNIYKIARSLKVRNKIKDFQYKILFRFLPTNRLLFKMEKIESPRCYFCGIVQETLLHLFFDCQIVKDFWLTVVEIWNDVNRDDKTATPGNILLGYFHDQIVNRDTFNLLILMGKYFIWRCKMRESNLNIIDFKMFVKYEFQVCNKNIQGPITYFYNI